MVCVVVTQSSAFQCWCWAILWRKHWANITAGLELKTQHVCWSSICLKHTLWVLLGSSTSADGARSTVWCSCKGCGHITAGENKMNLYPTRLNRFAVVCVREIIKSKQKQSMCTSAVRRCDRGGWEILCSRGWDQMQWFLSRGWGRRHICTRCHHRDKEWNSPGKSN